MKSYRLRILLIFVLFSCMGVAVSAQCVQPSSSVTSSQQLCTGSYTLDDEIVITGAHVELDCNGATLTGAKGRSVIVANATINAVVKNCKIENSFVGIFAHASTGLRVESNTLTNNERGIYLDTTTHASHLITNTITLSTKEAIGINGNANILEANELFDNYYGIYIYNTSQSNNLRFNRVNSNTFGAVIEGNTNTFESNVFDVNGDALRLLFSSSNTITNNRLSQSTQNGLFIYGGTSNQITRNNVSNNAKSGMVLLSAQGNQFVENTLSDNILAGMYMTALSDRNIISKNTFNGNGLYALNVNSSHDNVITQNTVMQSSFIIEAGSVDNTFCPGNTYSLGADGPGCAEENQEEEAVVATPQPTQQDEPEQAQPVPEIIKERVPTDVKFDAQLGEEKNEVVVPSNEVSDPESKFKNAILREVNPQPVKNKLTAEDIQFILDDILYREELDEDDLVFTKKELMDRIRATENKVVIKKNVQNTKDGVRINSKVNTSIIIHADMKDLHIYESIPKNCAESIEDIQFNQGIMQRPGVSFEIVRADPLIVWKFEEVKKGEEINLGYTVKNTIAQMPKTIVVESPDKTIHIREELICNTANVPKTLVLAEKIKAFSWLIMVPLALIVLVPIVLVSFAKRRQMR